MTDQELLLAIGDVVTKSLEPLIQRMDSLEQRMDSLEQRVDSLEESVRSLKGDVHSLNKRMDSLEKEVRRNNVMLENEVLPRLQTIEQLYVGSSKTYIEKSSQIDCLQEDVDVLKVVVQEHSEKMEKIS